MTTMKKPRKSSKNNPPLILNSSPENPFRLQTSTKRIHDGCPKIKDFDPIAAYVLQKFKSPFSNYLPICPHKTMILSLICVNFVDIGG